MPTVHVAGDMDPSDPIIKIGVRKATGETQTFHVHRGTLTQSSEFLRNAIKLEWKTADDTVNLLEDDADIVRGYIQWLYSNTVQIELYNGAHRSRKERNVEAEKVFVKLANAYVFGEKIVDVRFKNAVMQLVFLAKETSRWNFGPSSVEIVYDGTPPNSPLRRLIADSIASFAHDDTEDGCGWMKFFEEYPKDAVVDALKATVKARTRLPTVIPGHDSYLEMMAGGKDTASLI